MEEEVEAASVREPVAPTGEPARPRVRLDPMTAAEFGRYLEPAIREYAHQKVLSGDWEPHEAVELSRADHAQLLPDGLATPDQLLFTVRDEATEQPVGVLWLVLRMRAVKVEAYVYDLVVAEEVRGRGYGRATMLACLDAARKLG
ncbi:MAG TPA: GNAT family N-acetyltransferase, partial [Actinocrinis sp.]|uniref:GNAT family N-acetyltransferase n=1 Tax=Actinocrinis sp. TaxID=1920516 RepID=UPI002DDD7427